MSEALHRLTVVSDGSGPGTRVHLDGSPLRGVTSMTLEFGARGPVAATIRLRCDPDVVVEGEVDERTVAALLGRSTQRPEPDAGERTITVNGRTARCGATLTYREAVFLAGMTGNPTVTYSGPRTTRGDSRRSDEMHEGCAPVDVDDGAHFTVIHTGNA